MKIIIIGVGLIGGSLALKLRDIYKHADILGIDRNTEYGIQAQSLGIIDEICTEEIIPDADIVVVSVPVGDSLAILSKVLDRVSDHTLVFDVGSTKVTICDALRDHPQRRNFLAAHPIAGTEFSGPQAASKDLFQNKTNIICEIEKTAFKIQELAIQLFKDIGMRICYMSPKVHDCHIAYVSHLSHISSFMLGKTVMEKEKIERDIFDMAGSGFESTVRLAKSSPTTWTSIFEQNQPNIIGALDEYIDNLEQFKELVKNKDFQTLNTIMKRANEIQRILEGKFKIPMNV